MNLKQEDGVLSTMSMRFRAEASGGSPPAPRPELLRARAEHAEGRLKLEELRAEEDRGHSTGPRKSSGQLGIDVMNRWKRCAVAHGSTDMGGRSGWPLLQREVALEVEREPGGGIEGEHGPRQWGAENCERFER